MNAPPIIADASDLAATVERARALLTDGDVIAARFLSAAAYEQAKAQGKLAEQFGAAEQLVAKARRLQGDALLIETRAMQTIADDYDDAQAAGEVAEKGRPKNVAGDDIKPTIADFGLTRQAVHLARRLRDAERKSPGIVERAIAARLAAGLEPSRANLRAAIGTASASKEERGNNLYETPPEAVRTLLTLESFGPLIWEPACGRGAISRLLEDAGHEVILSDLVEYGTATKDGECQHVADFLATRRTGMDDGIVGIGGAGRPDIVTNPPYGEQLNAFVAHALKVHRPRKMALLLNGIFLWGSDDEDRNFALDDNPPVRVLAFTRRLPMMHRDGWDGEKASSRMNTAWFIWEQDADGNYAGPTVLHRVDWKNFETDPPKGPVDLSSVEKAGTLPEAVGTRQRISKKNPVAKASEDNGRISAAMCAPMTGEVSRPDAGRSASATSEIMDATAGETAHEFPADLLPKDGHNTELSIGGMRKNGSGRIVFKATPEGFVWSHDLELKGVAAISAPFNVPRADFRHCLAEALDYCRMIFDRWAADTSSTFKDKHRAAANAASAWCAEKCAEWGLGEAVP